MVPRVSRCLRRRLKQQGGFVVGFGSPSDNSADRFNDARGFASVEDNRIRLINALFTVPMAEDSDNPNPARFVQHLPPRWIYLG